MRIIIIILICKISVSGQPLSFAGGDGDGFGNSLFLNSNSFFHGGANDGFSLFILQNNQELYTGGYNDGSAIEEFSNQNTIYRGGSDDGSTSTVSYFYFIWDGSTGSGWNIADNWNTNAVPTDERRVRIPAGVSTFPFLNAGTLKVGDDSGTGTFQAREIIIEAGALMVGRINNFIENYGLICVKGVLEIRNTNSQAFKNLNGANLIIKSGGEFRTNY